MTISTIRAALADACSSVGLNAVGYVTDDIQTPAAVIAIQPFDYQLVFSGTRGPLTFNIRVYVDRTDEVGAQQLLDDWIDAYSPTCLKTALELAAVATAAGTDYVWVKGLNTPVEQVTFGSVNYLSVEFTVEVVV